MPTIPGGYFARAAAVLALLLPLIAGIALVAPAPAAAAPVVTAQPPQLPTQSTLFTSNTTISGRTYACFRIPAVVRTGTGTLLAFADARLDANCDDTKEMDIVTRRSTDGGVTWSAPQIIARGLPGAPNTPAIDTEATPIVDATYNGNAGQVVLLYNVRELVNGSINGPDGPNPIKPHVMFSRDDGQSWTDPVDITDQVNPAGVRYFLTGPGHGIQLRPQSAQDGGRLLAPTYQTESAPDSPATLGHKAAAIYSDDHGEHWHRGASTGNVIGQASAGEASIAELSNGDLYMTARNNQATSDAAATTGDNRVTAISHDHGEHWCTDEKNESCPVVSSNLPGARIFAPVLSLDSVPRGDSFNQMVIAEPVYRDPKYPTQHGTLKLRSSFDDGHTWQTPAEGLTIAKAGAGYSDLTGTASGGIGVLYEAGRDPSKDGDTVNTYTLTSIRFTIVPAGQTVLTSPVTGARTPDTAPGGNAAVLRGAARLTAGKFGRAVTLTPNVDGATGRVEVPPSPAYGGLSGDFTVAADFTYNATTGLLPIVWGFGVGAGAPQIWVRAEPATNRIAATATTTTGSATLYSTRSYNDNAWHHVALERATTPAGQELSLWVDGTKISSAAAPLGAVSPQRPQPLEIGNRIDGAQPFAGSIDDVVLYSRALSAQELAAAATSGTYSGGSPLLHLPFDSGEADTRSWDDTDGDGQLDVFSRTTAGDLWYFPSVGDVTSGSAGDRFLQNHTVVGGTFGSSFHPARGDFDNDGVGDLIAVNDQGQLNFWSGQGDGIFSPPVVLMSGTSFSTVKAVSAGDFNADGLTDVVGLGFDGHLWWWPGNGDGTFGARQNLWPDTSFSGYTAVPTGDFNADGNTDVAGIDATGTLWWWAGNGNGGLSAARQLAAGTSFASYTRSFTGDVNADGHTDLVALDSSGAAHWWPGDGAGHISGTARSLPVRSQKAGVAPDPVNGGVYTF
ncbi:FG-GAP-like repeat-containing protein [Streptomyces sp. NPDC059373]